MGNPSLTRSQDRKVCDGQYEQLPVARHSLKAGAFCGNADSKLAAGSPRLSVPEIRLVEFPIETRRNVSIPDEVSGRRRGGETGRESSRKAKVYMRSPRVLTLSISRTCRFQIGIHISGQISRFTYPSGSVSFLNLALFSAVARATRGFFLRLSDPGPACCSLPLSHPLAFPLAASRSHHVAVASAVIFSLGSPHRGPWKRSSRRISRPVVQLTRKYCKLVPSTFAVLSPR